MKLKYILKVVAGWFGCFLIFMCGTVSNAYEDELQPNNLKRTASCTLPERESYGNVTLKRPNTQINIKAYGLESKNENKIPHGSQRNRILKTAFKDLKKYFCCDAPD